MRGWGRAPCSICGKMISSCGFGEWNHWRKHMRESGLTPPKYRSFDSGIGSVRWMQDQVFRVKAKGERERHGS